MTSSYYPYELLCDYLKFFESSSDYDFKFLSAPIVGSNLLIFEIALPSELSEDGEDTLLFSHSYFVASDLFSSPGVAVAEAVQSLSPFGSVSFTVDSSYDFLVVRLRINIL
ncbi:hypothetical protein [Dipodfec virus UA06Rod_3]|uniref:Uncharacterized protein n=1 Tax=Dipodfec virus UA06Rod_3 TaxID=2929323 RepID=A0A976N1U3_9VIRU|nr:hypothetical protein [Dipodfec virus UA06Rod_3]